MPSTPDSILRLELQATGENATTWGAKTNNNLELLGQAIAGAANVNVGGSGNYTLVASNYTTDEARAATLVLTGTLSGNRDVIVPSSPKHYTVLNQTSGAFTLTIRQSAGTGVVIPQGASLVVCTSTTCVEATGSIQIPPGSLMPYAGATAPSGWLLCAGQEVSRTTYANLFVVLGTVHGSGNGTTTFNLPDLRGRSIFGKDDMGGSAANRITNAVSGITGTTLGAAGGDQRIGTHGHTATQTAHNHSLNDPGHSHSLPGNLIAGSGPGLPSGSGSVVANYNTNAATTGITVNNATPEITVNNFSGGSSANIPPAIVLNYIIKT